MFPTPVIFEIDFFVTLKTTIPQFHQDFGIGFCIFIFSLFAFCNFF